jgi:glycosyltransferase involved in cell wall biosynthesis
MELKSRMSSFLFFVFFWVTYLLVAILRFLLGLWKQKSLHPKKEATSVLYLAAFFPENAGYHYRVALWKKQLEKEGIRVTIKSCYTDQQAFEHYLELKPTRFLVIGLWKRLFHVLFSVNYDRVVVRRSLLLYNEYGNLFLEKLLLCLHPAAILDFDDNMLRSNHGELPSWYGKLMLENRNKFTDALGLYRKFIVGSPLLKTMVLNANSVVSEKDIVVIPTCVDYHGKGTVNYDLKLTPLIIGWIGSNGNQRYLNDLIPTLNGLHRIHPLELHVISGKKYLPLNAEFSVENKKWSLNSEVENLLQCHVGIMPLKDTELERGKCGFKLIQYMGLGMVSISSAVGINSSIITHGENGFLVAPGDSWLTAFEAVLSGKPHLAQIGRNAQQTVSENYSFKSNNHRYQQFIHNLISID